MRIIAAILLFFLCSRITAQQIVWEKTYGNDLSDSRSRAVVETTDGGFLVAGAINDPAVFFFIKTDNKGDTLWTRQYFNNLNGNSCVFVVRLPDGGYMSMGLQSDLCSQLLVLKIDAKGDSLWSKTYGCYENVYPSTVSDGGYLVTGQKLTDKGYMAYLLKLDSLGNKQWENTYGGPEYTNGSSVITTRDGNYMLVGRNTVRKVPSGYDYGVYLAKVRPNGDSIWTKTFDGKDNTYGTAITETQSGGFIISGHTDSLGKRGAYIISIDGNGNLKWENTYGQTKFDSWGWSSPLRTTDDCYILTGTRGASGGFPPDYKRGDIYLAKIDSNGNVLWDRYYGGDWRDEGGVLKKTSDGGYVLLGTTLSFSGSVKYKRIYLAKLDSNFNVFGVGIDNHQPSGDNRVNDIKLYPNPATNSFTIEYAAKQMETVSIYNILGETIYHDVWLCGQEKRNIDVSSFSRGIYIIRIGSTVQKVEIE